MSRRIPNVPMMRPSRSRSGSLVTGHPGVATIGPGFVFFLVQHRDAGGDHSLLVRVGGAGVLVGEDVEVGEPDKLLRLAAHRRGEGAAHRDESALEVLEVDRLGRVLQHVAKRDPVELVTDRRLHQPGGDARTPGARSPCRTSRRVIPMRPFVSIGYEREIVSKSARDDHQTRPDAQTVSRAQALLSCGAGGALPCGLPARSCSARPAPLRRARHGRRCRSGSP